MDRCACNAHSLLTTFAPSIILPWWNPDGLTPGGIGGSTVGAYQAINATDYASSLVNLSNPGTNDLTENNGAVPWATGTGWGFVAASLKSFDTGITAAAITWSVLVQFSNFVLLGVPSNRYMTGTTSAGPGVSLLAGNRVTGQVIYGNGGTLQVVPALLTGNLGSVSATAYRNAVNDGVIPGGLPSSVSVFIGALNASGAASAHCTANIESVAIYNVTLTLAQVQARVVAMAAL